MALARSPPSHEVEDLVACVGGPGCSTSEPTRLYCSKAPAPILSARGDRRLPKVAMERSRQGQSPAGPLGSRAEARRLTAGAPATSGVARAGSPDSASRIILYNRHVIGFASIPREPGRAPIDGGHESRWREAIASWPDRTQAESDRGDRGGLAAAIGASLWIGWREQRAAARVAAD